MFVTTEQKLSSYRCRGSEVKGRGYEQSLKVQVKTWDHVGVLREKKKVMNIAYAYLRSKYLKDNACLESQLDELRRSEA